MTDAERAAADHLDLTGFLRDRYVEAEQVARAGQSCNDVHPQLDVYHPDGHPDPVAMRDIASKVAIIDEYESALKFVGAGELWGLYTAIRHLAAVYDAHPDYRAEWQPGHREMY